MSHYETLGIKPDATAEEVRFAWRRCCAKAHPDRGGDAAKMAAANLAYEELIDPERRASYDERGGADARPENTLGESEMARTVLLQLLARALRDSDEEVIGKVRGYLEQERAGNAQQREQRMQLVSRFERRIGRYRRRTDAEPNLVETLARQMIESEQQQIDMLDKHLRVTSMAQAILDDFELLGTPMIDLNMRNLGTHSARFVW